MATSRNNQFREYLKNKPKDGNIKRYKDMGEEPLKIIIQSFLDEREKKKASTTVKNYRKCITLLLKDLLPPKKNLDGTTFNEFLNFHGDQTKLGKTIEELKDFYLLELVANHKLRKNYVSTLFSVCNPFFNEYLGLNFKIKHIGKSKDTYYTRIKLSEINNILNHIDEKYRLKLQFEENDRKKQDIRKKWALDRFLIQTMKFTWARSIEIQNLNMADMNAMEKNLILHLRSEKRKKNPKEFQDIPVLEEYAEEWRLYKQYRCTLNEKDDAPAIVSLKGNRIDTSTIRRHARNLGKETGYDGRLTCHNIRRSMNTLGEKVFENKKVAKIHLGDKNDKIRYDHYNIPDYDDRRNELMRLYSIEDLPGEQLTPMELRKKESIGDIAYV
jgi:site-specific recombinase XerD